MPPAGSRRAGEDSADSKSNPREITKQHIQTPSWISQGSSQQGNTGLRMDAFTEWEGKGFLEKIKLDLGPESCGGFIQMNL